MRRCLLIIALSGCGRLDFEAAPADAPTGDADVTTILDCERSPITGPTWWVDPSGVDSNDGSQAAPVRTITRALALASATGGTIVVRPGAYTSEPNNEVRFDGGKPIRLISELRYRARVPRIQCVGCTDVVVEGFEITGSTLSGLQATGGVRVRFHDNVVHHGGSAGIRIAGTSSSIEVLANMVYDNTASAIHANDVDGLRIRGNVVFDEDTTPNGLGKIWLETATSAFVAENVVFRARGDDRSFGMIALRQTATTLIENNVVAGSPDAIGVYAAVGFDRATGSATIRNNTFAGPLPGTAFGLGVVSLMTPSSFVLVNNVWASAGTSQPFTDGSAPGGAMTVRRNLYWNAPTGAFAAGGTPNPGSDGEALVADPGLSFAIPAPPSWSSMTQQFAGGGTTICDVRARLVESLAAIPRTSAAVGAADAAHAPSHDILGRARRSPPALGAYEPP